MMMTKQHIRSLQHAATVSLPQRPLRSLLATTALLLALTACSSASDDAAAPATPVARTQGSMPLTVMAASPAAGTAETVVATTRTNGYDVQNYNYLHADYTGDAPTRRVGLFVLRSGQNSTTTSESNYERMNVACNNTTTLSTQWNKLNYTADDNQLYYPDADTQPIDLYAYAPYNADAAVSDISTDQIAFTLSQDQTATTDYVGSDVLWGCAGTGSNITAAVANDGAYGLLQKGIAGRYEVSAHEYHRIVSDTDIPEGKVNNSTYYKESATAAHAVVPLLHRGAKVIVRCNTHGMDLDRLKNATVQLRLPHVQGQLTLSNGTFTADDTEDTRVKNITLTSRLGIAAPAASPALEGALQSDKTTAATTDDDAKYYTCAAVVVPQTYSADAAYNLIEIDLYGKTTAHDDGATVTDNPMIATYGFNPTEAIQFVSGKRYVFDVTVRASTMTVALTVEDWADGSLGDITGTGLGSTLDGTVTHYTFNAAMDIKKDPVVGDLYFSDGTWGTLADNTSGAEKTADDIIGIVFSTETSGIDKSLGYRRGYVMALKDVSVGNWCTNTSSLQTTAITGAQYASTVKETQWNSITTDMDGLTRCKTARKYCTDNSIDESNLTAIMACVNYTPAAPAKSSGWYLPTVGQLHQIRLSFATAYSTQLSTLANYTYETTGTTPSLNFRLASTGIHTNVTNAINTYVTGKLPSGYSDYTSFEGHILFSCTERNGSQMYAIDRLTDSIYLSGNHNKSKTDNYVRPVLAF